VIEGCGEVGNAALAFAVGIRPDRDRADAQVRTRARIDWVYSDRGLPQFRIVRDGCFRAAIPLPPAVQIRDIHAIRAIAYERPPAEGTPRAPPTPVRLPRINKMFILDGDSLPSPSRFEWNGSATTPPGGPPLDLPVP